MFCKCPLRKITIFVGRLNRDTFANQPLHPYLPLDIKQHPLTEITMSSSNRDSTASFSHLSNRASTTSNLSKKGERKVILITGATGGTTHHTKTTMKTNPTHLFFRNRPRNRRSLRPHRQIRPRPTLQHRQRRHPPQTPPRHQRRRPGHHRRCPLSSRPLKLPLRPAPPQRSRRAIRRRRCALFQRRLHREHLRPAEPG